MLFIRYRWEVIRFPFLPRMVVSLFLLLVICGRSVSLCFLLCPPFYSGLPNCFDFYPRFLNQEIDLRECFCFGWNIFTICMNEFVLESYFIILLSIFGYSRFNPLGLCVIVHHFILAQTGRHWLHFEKYSTVLFFSLDYFSFSNWFQKCVVFDPWGTVIGGVWCVSGEWFYIFKFT